MIKGTKIR